MSRWTRDPLLLLLAAGALLYLVIARLSPAASNVKRIVVDREQLLEFIQFRASAFEPRAAAALLDDMDAATRQQLIDDYVHEEAFYREAGALGMQANDYVIRRRMVQKLEFLLESAIGVPQPADGELEGYFTIHADAYREPATVSFVHVFVEADNEQPDNARARAALLQQQLNDQRIAPSQAPAFGQRFPYQVAYQNRSAEFVASHFGAAFAASVFDSDLPAGIWSEPLRSDHGWHSVHLQQRQAARMSDFNSLRARVAADWQADEKQRLLMQAAERVIGRFDIDVDPSLTAHERR